MNQESQNFSSIIRERILRTNMNTSCSNMNTSTPNPNRYNFHHSWWCLMYFCMWWTQMLAGRARQTHLNKLYKAKLLKFEPIVSVYFEPGLWMYNIHGKVYRWLTNRTATLRITWTEWWMKITPQKWMRWEVYFSVSLSSFKIENIEWMFSNDFMKWYFIIIWLLFVCVEFVVYSCEHP